MLVLAFSLRNANGIVTVVSAATRALDDHRTPVGEGAMIVTSDDHADMEVTVAKLRAAFAGRAASPADFAFHHVDMTGDFGNEVSFPTAALVHIAGQIGAVDPKLLLRGYG